MTLQEATLFYWRSTLPQQGITLGKYFLHTFIEGDYAIYKELLEEDDYFIASIDVILLTSKLKLNTLDLQIIREDYL